MLRFLKINRCEQAIYVILYRILFLLKALQSQYVGNRRMKLDKIAKHLSLLQMQYEIAQIGLADLCV